MHARLLYHVPIIHTEADLGGLAGAVRAASGHDPHARARAAAAVDDLWRRIERWAETLGPALHGVRLYQDGLPVCGKEAQIVEDLATRGSVNHRLLRRLAARGATIMGTEDPRLLVREYELLRAALGVATGAASGAGQSPGASDPARERTSDTDARRDAASRELLAERDRFIARRIDETLRPGERGVLFIGALHRAREFLPADIRVEDAIALRAASDRSLPTQTSSKQPAQSTPTSARDQETPHAR